MFTDADVILPPGWVATAMALFEDPSVPAIQGNSRTRGEKALASLLDREYREFVQSHAATGFADLCDTRCFGIRREIFEKYPFEKAEVYTEDSGLGRRLFEAGIRIRFAPEWEVEHHARGSMHQELIRFRGYASASQRRLLRTGLDLFRAPGSPLPRGPGADLLRVALRFPFTARVLSRGVWALARALGRASEIAWGAPAPIFLRARRAAMLSGRLDPDEATQRRLARGAAGRSSRIGGPPEAPGSQSRPKAGPSVTIVAVPRERFSLTARALESLYENTDTPFRLVYVDGGSPLSIARYLDGEAARRGFELIRSERYLAPNEARNRGWLRADTRYVVFVDNDLVVTRGWLTSLLRCAEETGADLVGPLYGIGEPEKGAIHMAGGLARIVEKDGRRRLSESHRFAGRWFSDVEAQLAREPVELVEFHCMLARRETLLAHGPLDEELRSAAEHLDLCLFVKERGGSIYLEPSARVSYVPPPPLDRSDREYFRLRWSEAWTARSMARMREKWRLDPEDPYFAEQVRWLRSHRRLRMRPVQDAIARLLGARLARYPNGALALAEIGWNRLRVRGAIRGRGPRTGRGLTREIAQTNLQLYRQLAGKGATVSELVEIRQAYELAVSLFGGTFRASGKPFVAHLVGTASVLARERTPITVVTAGLLHAAYVQGDFGDGPPGRTRRRSRRLILSIGAESERLVARYATFPWSAEAPPDPGLVPSLDAIDRGVVLMRLANEIEEFADGDALQHADGTSRARNARRALPAWIRWARELEAPEIAATLERLQFDSASALPDELRSAHVRSFRARPPLSHDIGSRFRAAVESLRALRRFVKRKMRIR